MVKYIEAEMEIVEFEVEDVISTSCKTQIEQMECGCNCTGECYSDGMWT